MKLSTSAKSHSDHVHTWVKKGKLSDNRKGLFFFLLSCTGCNEEMYLDLLPRSEIEERAKKERELKDGHANRDIHRV